MVCASLYSNDRLSAGVKMKYKLCNTFKCLLTLEKKKEEEDIGTLTPPPLKEIKEGWIFLIPPMSVWPSLLDYIGMHNMTILYFVTAWLLQGKVNVGSRP